MAIISWVRRRSGYYGHARRSPDIFRRTRGRVPEGRHVLAGAHGPAAGFGRDERRQPGQNRAVPRDLDSERPIAAGPAPLEKQACLHAIIFPNCLCS